MTRDTIFEQMRHNYCDFDAERRHSHIQDILFFFFNHAMSSVGQSDQRRCMKSEATLWSDELPFI